jgi:hypothetical protein
LLILQGKGKDFAHWTFGDLSSNTFFGVLPKKGPGPSPVFLLLNNEKSPHMNYDKFMEPLSDFVTPDTLTKNRMFP